jgi:hypothetical protein
MRSVSYQVAWVALPAAHAWSCQACEPISTGKAIATVLYCRLLDAIWICTNPTSTVRPSHWSNHPTWRGVPTIDRNAWCYRNTMRLSVSQCLGCAIGKYARKKQEVLTLATRKLGGRISSMRTIPKRLREKTENSSDYAVAGFERSVLRFGVIPNCIQPLQFKVHGVNYVNSRTPRYYGCISYKSPKVPHESRH